MSAPSHLGDYRPLDQDSRVDEVIARFARIEAEEAERQQNGLFPQ